ncbi:MAG: NAD(P)H-dependent oxidoreductase subunit E [Clostridia bacterium]
MAKIKLTKIPFKADAAKEKELRERLSSTKTMKGGLMPSLQAAQEIYGYLPIEVQKIIATELNIPLEEIFGVVTFYSQFTLNPRGKYQVSVCMGTACYVKGAGDVLEKLEEVIGLAAGETTEDAKFSLAGTRCIGCCGLAPVMTVNDQVFGKVTKNDMPKIMKPFLTAE